MKMNSPSSENSNGFSSREEEGSREASPLKKESGGGPGKMNLNNLRSPQQETVEWLKENYEVDNSISLPRDTIYRRYCEFCASGPIEKMGTASFGKMVRLVFPQIRTRRLGVRGQSKYHYHGIKVKDDSPIASKEMNARSSSLTMKKVDKVMRAEGFKARQPELVVQVPPISSSFNHNVTLHLPQLMGPPETVHFSQVYQDHCHSLLTLIRKGDFGKLNQELTHTLGTFWNSLPEVYRIFIGHQEVVDYVHHCDLLLYSAILKSILPDALKDIPLTVTQAIRNFGKNVFSLFQNALVELLPQNLYNVKIEVVKGFAHVLKRTTSLNHLAQAAKAVWQNDQQVTQMLDDWLLVDFKNVHEQAMFACGCEEETIIQVEREFEACLQKQRSVDDWALFLENFISKKTPFVNNNISDFRLFSKHLLLKWSYYCSLIIRDLTLRSATSFGSFHLIRLFYEEYLCLLVDRRYISIRGRELASKFPNGFFEHVYPSLVVALDHTVYFQQIPQSQHYQSHNQNQNQNGSILPNLSPISTNLNSTPNSNSNSNSNLSLNLNSTPSLHPLQSQSNPSLLHTLHSIQSQQNQSTQPQQTNQSTPSTQSQPNLPQLNQQFHIQNIHHHQQFQQNIRPELLVNDHNHNHNPEIYFGSRVLNPYSFSQYFHSQNPHHHPSFGGDHEMTPIRPDDKKN